MALPATQAHLEKKCSVNFLVQKRIQFFKRKYRGSIEGLNSAKGLPVYGHVHKTIDVEFCLNLLLAFLSTFELKDDELSLDLKREGKEIAVYFVWLIDRERIYVYNIFLKQYQQIKIQTIETYPG